jgi:predicted dehydrogenase
MTRLKVGVIGCGAIAQVWHLPHMREHAHQFEIRALCDLSRQLLAAVGDQYGVPAERRYTDYREMVESDVEAVIVCPSASHAEPSIAAARAGKHVFVEKPMCTTEREAREMVAAADQAGVVLQVGYMKRHDPAYQYARARLPEMPEVNFIQVNHLHCDNGLHLRDFRILRFDDLPAGVREAGQAERRQRVAEALGVDDLDRVEPLAQRAFGTILGSMIHDIGNLSGFFGPPTRVVGTELWANGRGINTVIQYPHDRRAICSWVDLPELWEFTETFEVYGSRDRVRVSFPSGFARGMMSTVNVHGMEADGRPWRKELIFHDNPFRLELLHFRECVLEGRQPITPGREAVADIKLVADIVRAYLDRAGMPS